jgi:hypothetical protein
VVLPWYCAYPKSTTGPLEELVEIWASTFEGWRRMLDANSASVAEQGIMKPILAPVAVLKKFELCLTRTF